MPLVPSSSPLSPPLRYGLSSFPSRGGMARTPRIHPAYRSYFLGSVVSAASWSRSPVFHTFTPVSLARGAAATEGSREPCNECSEGSGDPHPPSLSVEWRPEGTGLRPTRRVERRRMGEGSDRREKPTRRVKGMSRRPSRLLRFLSSSHHFPSVLSAHLSPPPSVAGGPRVA